MALAPSARPTKIVLMKLAQLAATMVGTQPAGAVGSARDAGYGENAHEHWDSEHRADHLRVQALGFEPDREKRQLDACHHENGGVKPRETQGKAEIPAWEGLPYRLLLLHEERWPIKPAD